MTRVTRRFLLIAVTSAVGLLATLPAVGGDGVTMPADGDDGLLQLLRTTQRATITRAVTGHEPAARGNSVRLAVEIEMLPGMHVNANPPTHDWMIPVEVSVDNLEGVRVVEAFYPQPVSRKFPYDEEPYRVYEGTFVVGLMLAIDADAPAGGRELEIVLDYQACNDEACFAPAKTSIKLPIMVVADAAQSVAVSSELLDRAPFPRG